MEGLINCTFIEEDEIMCGNLTFHEEEKSLGPSDTMFWVFFGASFLFTIFAGIMSGLTIGYFSLNSTNLSVISKGKDLKMKQRADRVIKVTQRKHMLLVTLLLSNAFAMESLPLCIDRIASPVLSIVISVTAVLFFGEVIPQSICSRYALQIGSFFAYPVLGLMIITSPISFPIAKLLDYLLGSDHITYYKREELVELVNMHGTGNEGNEEPLSIDEVTIIRGALEMKNKNIGDCMTILENVFMLSDQTILDKQVLQTILDRGHSRIPIYRNENKQIATGLILTKKLLLLDTDNPKKICDMEINPIIRFPKDYPLYSILNEFQTGKSHISLVCDGEKVLGIITIEDVIEELIQEEILDETDGVKSIQQKLKAVKLIDLERRAASAPISSKISLPFSDKDHLLKNEDEEEGDL